MHAFISTQPGSGISATKIHIYQWTYWVLICQFVMPRASAKKNFKSTNKDGMQAVMENRFLRSFYGNNIVLMVCVLVHIAKVLMSLNMRLFGILFLCVFKMSQYVRILHRKYDRTAQINEIRPFIISFYIQIFDDTQNDKEKH